jgi:glycosyltransferase involved in cell wall biosynthesis
MSRQKGDRAYTRLDVLIVASSDPRYDSRSSKYLSCLLEAGLNARVIGISSDGTSDESDSLTRIPVTRRAGKRFFLQFYQRIISEVRKSPAKVVIAGDLFSLPPSIINKRRFSRKGLAQAKKDFAVKLIYDSKELYEELPSLKLKRSSFLFWNFVERASIKYIDQVLTVNKSIADILESKWHLPTTVIMNVADVACVPAIGGRSLDKVMLVFSGGLQDGRGLHNLIRLLTLLPDRYELRFVGEGGLRTELENLAASLNLSSRVHFTGRVKNTEVIEELSKATLGIYLMENSGLCHYLALPNKLFQFISARLPVIVPTFPEMEKIVSQFEIGAAVDPANIDAVASKVLELTSSRENYLRLVENCEKAANVLNWKVEKEKFLEVIRRLVQ